jgi:hypothetical protein
MREPHFFDGVLFFLDFSSSRTSSTTTTEHTSSGGLAHQVFVLFSSHYILATPWLLFVLSDPIRSFLLIRSIVRLGLRHH